MEKAIGLFLTALSFIVVCMVIKDSVRLSKETSMNRVLLLISIVMILISYVGIFLSLLFN